MVFLPILKGPLKQSTLKGQATLLKRRKVEIKIGAENNGKN